MVNIIVIAFHVLSLLLLLYKFLATRQSDHEIRKTAVPIVAKFYTHVGHMSGQCCIVLGRDLIYDLHPKVEKVFFMYLNNPGANQLVGGAIDVRTTMH